MDEPETEPKAPDSGELDELMQASREMIERAFTLLDVRGAGLLAGTHDQIQVR